MDNPPPQQLTRRRFVQAVGGATFGALTAPAVVTASKTDSKIVLGSGDYRYEVQHDWPQLPRQFTWQTTHGVAFDRDGCLYVLHQGLAEQPEHPAIFVFDPEGRYIRSFGQMFSSGGHGLEIHEENGEEFLYVCAYVGRKCFAKLDKRGEVVWVKHAPVESGVYVAGEEKNADRVRGRDRFLPTNFAFLPDGGFLLADGYGSFTIHRYDRDGNWLSCFGGPGEGDATFDNPHGIAVDARPGREPAIVVTDRMRHQLKYFSLDGKYQSTVEGFLLPCHFDFRGDVMLVPDLDARITLLDKENRPLAHLADDAEWRKAVNELGLRGKPEAWQPGKFLHPHDACFDAAGNIIVAEWVVPGRVSRLVRT